MQSKHLVRFYGEHCSRTIAKISGCDKQLTELKLQIQSLHEQSEYIQKQLSTLWFENFNKAMLQRDIFALKRRESFMLARHDDVSLKLQETASAMENILERRDGFIKLRLYYEKKKKKWEWMSDRAKKMRIRKDIHSDEQAAEECVTWSTQ